MQFYSRFNRPETIPAPACSKLIPVFEIKIDKQTGRKELKQTGKTNVYEKIQASKENTLIYNILEKYQNGDISVLQKARGVFGDFTNMPKTLAEAQQSMLDAENLFNKLPNEIKREFSNSTSEFLASMTNGQFEQIVKKYQKPEKVEQKTATQIEGGSKVE